MYLGSVKRETTIFYVSNIIIVLLAYFIQTKTFFSPDVGYLLHAANQVLAGGKYGPDIFETNPPMILYLYFPACILAKLTTISIITAVRLYIIFLAIISLWLCFFLLKKLIKQQDKTMRYFLFYTLIFAMLLLPSFVFAQREHILIILMLPYLLSAPLALENKSVHPAVAVLIGGMAGLGFALKPFFLVTPCLIELYFFAKRRRLFAWVRIESVIIISVLVIYLGSIFLLQPNYINIVLPLVLRYYFPAMALSWNQIILFPNVLFCVAVMLGYLIYYKQDRYSSLGWVLELALLGMVIAFLVPQAPWYYHVMPALVLALLLVAHFLGQTAAFITQKSASQRWLSWDSAILIMGAVIILMFPASHYYRTMRYLYEFQDKQPARFIADYINKQAGQHSIACFGLGTPDCFPLIYYTHSLYAERFPSFWWYFGLRQLEKSNQPTAVLIQVAKDKKYFIDSFADDLYRYKARWVIIDTLHFKHLETNQFDIISYFSENEKFHAAWQHYHYLTTIKSVKLYERTA